MKKLIALLLALPILCCAQSNILTGNIASFGMAGRTNLEMQLSIVSPKHRVINNIFISDDSIISSSDTNGNFSFTNIAFGYYILSASDSTGSRWPILVFTDTTGITQLKSLINFNAAIPQNGGTNYYTIAQINSMFAALSVSVGGATNALIEGPGGVYDASLVTNVTAGAITGIILTNNLPMSQLAGVAGIPGTNFLTVNQTNTVNTTNSVTVLQTNVANVTNSYTFSFTDTNWPALTNGILAVPLYLPFGTGLPWAKGISGIPLNLSAGWALLGTNVLANYFPAVNTNTFIWPNAAYATTAGTANNLSSLINVSSYGAVGFYTNQQSSTFNGHLLPDLTTNIQNALNASATANGCSNTVVFGPGIFRITTNIIASSKVKIIGQGQLHDGRGGIDAITNGWSIIWVDNTNSPGLVFMQQQQSHSELWNIEINGYSNPLASLAAMINANTTNFDNGIGVWVIGAVGQVYAGGFYDNHVAIHGFRVGMWCQQNNVVHDFLDMSGNDVGFVAWNDFTSSPYLTGYYSHLLTNVFNLWNTNYQDVPANSDNQIFNVAAGGMRFGSVDYLFNNTYGMTVNQQGEQNLTMFGIFSSCGVIVNGLLSELNEGSASNVFGTCIDPNYRPLIQTYYRVGLYMKNGNFLSKTAYPAWYTNSCIINAQDSIAGEFDNVNGLNTWMSTTNWLYSFNYGSGPVPRVRDPYQKSLFLFYGQVYSSIGDLNSCQTAQIGANYYGNVIADYASSLGSLVKQYPSGAEEFITFAHSMSGGSANPTIVLSRIAQSDSIAVSNYTANVRTLPPRNFTFDQVTVSSSGASVIITNNTITTGTISATNFTGNGSGLTGLQASGISTNGGITGQVMINGGNGTVLWTNNQSIVAAGTGETTETMSTNPVTGQVTYTSNVNTNQFLGAGVGWQDGVNVTNINASANGLVTNTPAGIAAAGGNTNLSSAYITTNGATTSGYVPTATGASGAYNWQAPSSLSGGSYTFTTNCFAGFPSDIVQAYQIATISFPTVNRMYGMVWYNNKNLVINRVIFACGAVTNGFNVGVSIYSWPAGVKLLDTGAISPVVGLNTNTLSPSMTTLTNGFYTVGWTAGTNAALTFIGISNFQNNITPFTSFGLFNSNGAQGTNGLTLGSFPTSAQSTTISAMVPILYFMP